MSPERPHPCIGVIAFGPVGRPNGGCGVRALAVVDALQGLGCGVTVVAGAETPASRVALIRRGVGLVELRRPLRFGFSRELVAACRDLRAEVDAWVVESALLLPALKLTRPCCPVIWDTTECETLHYRRLPRRPRTVMAGVVWQRLERWAARRAAVVVAISATEADWWARLVPASAPKLMVVPHRVPSDRQTVVGGLGDPPARSQRTVVFVGNAGAKHNRTACQWIAQHLSPERLGPDVDVILVGPGTESFRDPGRPTLQARGEVADVEAVIDQADVCVAPLRSGAGVKTKVLHYVSRGKRVVGTSIAFEGLEGCPGLTVSELPTFVDRLRAMLNEPEPAWCARQRADEQARWYGCHHGAGVVAATWEAVLARVRISVDPSA